MVGEILMKYSCEVKVGGREKRSVDIRRGVQPAKIPPTPISRPLFASRLALHQQALEKKGTTHLERPATTLNPQDVLPLWNVAEL